MNNYVYDDEGFFRVTEIFVYGSGKRDLDIYGFECLDGNPEDYLKYKL